MPDAANSLHVLIVEDDWVSRIHGLSLLRSYGCTVSTAHTSADALQVLADRPDTRLVILDWFLADGTGERFLTALPGLRPVPPAVWLWSARPKPQIVQLAEALGVQGVLHKPLTRTEVRPLLVRLGMKVPPPVSPGGRRRRDQGEHGDASSPRHATTKV